MRRFVVLTHDHPFLHWDLMLDVEESAELKTWRLLAEPLTTESIGAEVLPDHRRKYLDYEGPVSGNRGTVKQWDAGTFELIGDSEDEVRVRFHGIRLSGEFTIISREHSSVFRQA